MTCEILTYNRKNVVFEFFSILINLIKISLTMKRILLIDIELSISNYIC